jgi:hypothetical protein
MKVESRDRPRTQDRGRGRRAAILAQFVGDPATKSGTIENLGKEKNCRHLDFILDEQKIYWRESVCLKELQLGRLEMIIPTIMFLPVAINEYCSTTLLGQIQLFKTNVRKPQDNRSCNCRDVPA